MMSERISKDPTHYLPSARADRLTVRRQHRLFTGDAAFHAILNALPNAVAVLNEQRQIVFANTAFGNLSHERELMALLGKRVGEALRCLNLPDNPGGCGTGKFCTTCGAAHAMAAAARRKGRVEECRILRQIDGVTTPLDLRVTATPYELDGTNFTIFVISDIGDEKRRQVLERIFFHDIGNTVGNIRGLAELLVASSGEQPNDFAAMVYRASERLLDEVEAQRQLLAAEEGRLDVELRPVELAQFLQELRAFYTAHPVATGRTLRLETAPSCTLHTDSALLGRVLGNMVKNALEASGRGETVSLGYTIAADAVHFRVHNPGTIPHTVQLQLFQRSFSTKSAGRGLGTYSMKLLAEHYLGGSVGFTSGREDGTTFTLTLPRSPG